LKANTYLLTPEFCILTPDLIMFLFSRFSLINYAAITLGVAIAGCSPATLLSSFPVAQINQENQVSNDQKQTESEQWRQMTAEEEEQIWQFLIVL
jgi:hypothetical protein